jgi:hypothetical protein
LFEDFRYVPNSLDALIKKSFTGKKWLLASSAASLARTIIF